MVLTTMAVAGLAVLGLLACAGLYFILNSMFNSSTGTKANYNNFITSHEIMRDAYKHGQDSLNNLTGVTGWFAKRKIRKKIGEEAFNTYICGK